MLPNAMFCWQCGVPHPRNPTPSPGKATSRAPAPRGGDPSDDDDDGDDEFIEGEEEDESEGEDDPEVDPLVTEPPFCTNCGTQFAVSPGSNFCRVCGAVRPADETFSAAAAAPLGAGSRRHGAAPSGASGSGGHSAELPFGLPREADRNSTKASTATRQVRESKLVKQREITHFKLPLLAGDAAEQRGWINGYLAYMRRFDATQEDFLFKWSNKYPLS